MRYICIAFLDTGKLKQKNFLYENIWFDSGGECNKLVCTGTVTVTGLAFKKAKKKLSSGISITGYKNINILSIKIQHIQFRKQFKYTVVHLVCTFIFYGWRWGDKQVAVCSVWLHTYLLLKVVFFFQSLRESGRYMNICGLGTTAVVNTHGHSFNTTLRSLT